MQLLIYCERITPRIDYICSVLFSALGIEHSIETNKAGYINFEAAKINYSSQRIPAEEIWINPVNFLFESNVQKQEIKCFESNNAKAFFQTPESDFAFDIFAASFYLVSRYEEYLPHTIDMYGRYAHENSLAFKEGFLHLPLVNIWLKEFEKKLLQKFPSLKCNPTHFQFLPTYDIDIAWSYLNKGWWRNAGAMLKSMVNGEWSIVKERIEVLLHKKKDPFDSYAWLDELHDELGLKPLYFFLLAQKNKGYDKNILPSTNALRTMISVHRKKYNVGIHPSWQSGDDTGLLKHEIQLLETITEQPITKSRQHYIRLNLPDTYEQLIQEGITEDYSMGYGSINGFRASYCLPFKWYNLKTEKSSQLTVYPFCFMDANSFYEQRYNLEQALSEMLNYLHTVREVDGFFITIWHNQFLGTGDIFKGWKEVYETCCRKALEAK